MRGATTLVVVAALALGACTTAPSQTVADAPTPESITTSSAAPSTTAAPVEAAPTTTAPAPTTTLAPSTTTTTSVAAAPEPQPELIDPEASPIAQSATMTAATYDTPTLTGVPASFNPGTNQIDVANDAISVSVTFATTIGLTGVYCPFIGTCFYWFHATPTWNGVDLIEVTTQNFDATGTIPFPATDGDDKLSYYTYGGFGDFVPGLPPDTITILIHRLSS